MAWPSAWGQHFADGLTARDNIRADSNRAVQPHPRQTLAQSGFVLHPCGDLLSNITALLKIHPVSNVQTLPPKI